MNYKRIFDIILSVLGIFLFSPVFILTAISIKFVMPNGPIFFKQKRIGINGQLFSIIKFRTMKVADDFNNSIAVLNKHRLTPFGRALRKYKIDELPELFNVLKGEMSFVGPRPDVEGYADKLEGESRKILLLRPGITGPASLKYADEEQILKNVEDPVNYNDYVIYPDKVRINLEYYYNNSIFGDIIIILKTIFRIYK